MAFLAPVAAEGALAAAPVLEAGLSAAAPALEGAAMEGAKDLATFAGKTAAPILAKKFGKGAVKLAPHAEKALGHILSSKSVHQGLQHAGTKIGNALFGKHLKTARDMHNKVASVAGVAFSPEAHSVLKTGLEIGKGLGFVSDDQAKNITGLHKHAMTAHDQLSKFNKVHQQLAPQLQKRPVTKPIVSPLQEALSRPQAPRPPR